MNLIGMRSSRRKPSIREDTRTTDVITMRRSIIASLGAGAAALAVGSRTALAQARVTRFQPARHPQDPSVAESIGADTAGNTDGMYRELLANAVPNSHVVSAGVLAANRAQEYGYTLLTAL